MLNFKILTTTLLIGLSTCSMSAKADLAVLDTISWGGGTYHLIEAATWDDSEARAVELGGHLITIDSQEENDFIYKYWGYQGSSLIVNANYLWTGLNDAENEGEFVWSSGQDVLYTNFNPGEPNGDVNENHVHLWTSGAVAGKWNDLRGSRGTDYANFGVFGVVEINTFNTSGSLVSNVPAPFFLSLTLPIVFAMRRRNF